MAPASLPRPSSQAGPYLSPTARNLGLSGVFRWCATFRAGKEPMTELRLMDVARPYLWVAATAFTIGFAGYLIFGQPRAPAYAERSPPVASDSLRAA